MFQCGINKHTLNTELLVATSRGEQLSPDRLVRVAHAAKQDSEYGGGLACSEAGRQQNQLGRGADIAMAFMNDDERGYHFQLGRVLAMYNGSKEWKKPIGFASRPAPLKVVARWYASEDRQGLKYRYNTDDSSRYFAKFIVALPSLTYDRASETYALDPQEKAAIEEAMRSLNDDDE